MSGPTPQDKREARTEALVLFAILGFATYGGLAVGLSQIAGGWISLGMLCPLVAGFFGYLLVEAIRAWMESR